MIVNPPSYRLNAFGDCDALGWHLGIPANRLSVLAGEADNLYYLARRIPKSDGSFRDVFAAQEPLRSAQKKILDRILREVYFPRYLLGGIRDTEYARDYVRNAKLHSGAGTLIQEDVASFFPATTRAIVARTFRGVFHFPEAVADCLAKLCTRNNELVQGASTSTYLANLILWDREPLLEAALRQIGCRYTRYVDDINVSCRRILTASVRTEIVHAIYQMLRAYGYQPKRVKQAVLSKGQAMSLHGLNIDRSHPKLSREERKRIRSAVHQLEWRARTAPYDPGTWSSALSVRSRVSIWQRLDASQAQRYCKRVSRVVVEIKHLHL